MSMLSRYASLAAPVAAASTIEYVGGTTASIAGSTSNNTNVSLTSLTGGLASSPAAGDIVIVYYGVASGNNDRVIGVTTAGYTEVAELFQSDTFAANLSVSYKVMDLTPDTQVTVSATEATSDGGAVAIHVWRGVDKVMPMDVTRTTATKGNEISVDPPSITPSTAGAVIVSGGVGATNNQGTFSSSDLSNFITLNSGGSNAAVIGLGSTAWTSGAFNPALFTYSGNVSGTQSWAAVTLALRPNQNQAGPFLISQASAQKTSSDSNIIVNKPTGTRQGDLMIACMNAPGSITWTGADGWTEVADQGASPATRIAYKVAGAGEGASYTFTTSGATTQSATILTYRNAAYDAVGAIQTAQSPLVVNAVTASENFTRIISTVGRAAASITITGPTGMETIFTDNDSTSPSRLIAQDANLRNSGTSGTRSFTVGSTTNVSGALVAVKPAASYTKYAQYIAQTNNNAAASTTLTINKSTCVPGNLLILVGCISSSSTTTETLDMPAGWLPLRAVGNQSTAYRPGFYISYRVADGSEPASYDINSTNSVNLFGAMITLAGVDPSTIAVGSETLGSATANITASNGVTATANGILLFFGVQNNDNRGVPTFTAPSGMTEAVDVGVNGNTNDGGLIIAYQEGLSAGSTGSKTATSTFGSGAGTYIYRALQITVDAK